MKRLTSLAFIGALALASLTACSAGGDDTADFCALATSLDADDSFELNELSDTAMQDALAGNMSGVNEWGDTSAATLEDLTAKLRKAKGGAPTDEIAQALVDLSEGMELLQMFAESASDATDLDTFLTEIGTIGSEIEAVDDRMTAASDVLDAAKVKYCS